MSKCLNIHSLILFPLSFCEYYETQLSEKQISISRLGKLETSVYSPKSTQPTTRAEVPQQPIAMCPTTISDLVNALFDTEQTTQKQENKPKKKKRKKIQI
jgi:hypothetical protein